MTRPTTSHATELVREIAVTAPDGVRRVPFSILRTAPDELNVFSYTDGGSIIDRFALGGEHRGVIARFQDGSGEGQLASPTGVAADTRGHLFIPDAGRSCIVELDPSGRVVAERGHEGSAAGELRAPRDLDVSQDGDVVIADTDNHRIQVWRADGGVVACSGPTSEDEDDEAPFLASGSAPGQLFRPRGVTTDQGGRIWVADTNNHRIQRFSRQLAFMDGFASGLHFPIDLRIDGRGRVVVVDHGGLRVQWFSADGALECAIQPLDALPDGAAVVDVDVDDDGTVYLPIGPLSRIAVVKPGGRQ